MSYKHHWANPTTTSGWQNYPNGFVYTGGIPFPSTRLDWYGNRPIRVHSFGDFYGTGAGTFFRMNWSGNLADQGNITVFGNSGGTFQWECHQGNISNQMFFGRDQAQGRQVVSANDGFVWAGTLAGSFWWDEVPSDCYVDITITGGNDVEVVPEFADNGGTGIISWTYQIKKDSGSWQTTAQDSGSDHWHYTDLAPGTYRFRAWVRNAVGYSRYVESSSYVIGSSGGKRYTGSTWTNTSTAKRFNGSSWVNLATAKRWNGSSWVNLS
jgi:hypothetical protein